MRFSVLITDRAAHDMENAAEYIEYTLKNPIAADRLLSECKKAAAELGEMPERWKLVDDPYLSSQGIRYFSIKNYLMFYQIDHEEKTVLILRFLYGRSNWKSILKG